MRKLNDYFDDFFFIFGNHDSYYRDKLEMHSLPFIDEFENIHAVDDILEIGDFAFVPWLTNDEWRRVPDIKASYVFGHFELPKFKMNAMIEMPDHGLLNSRHFQNQKMVFSGHFHKRQNQGKIWYIGNAFPHDFSDAWDDDRGMMLFEPGKTPEFKSWPQAPKFRTALLSDVLVDPTAYIDKYTSARITVDVSLSYEELTFIKELFEVELHANDVTLNSGGIEDVGVDGNVEINFQSVDTIVVSHLQSIESNTMESQRLVDIYNSL